MTPDPKDKATGQNKPTQKEDTPSATEDTTSKRHHPVQAIPKEKDSKLSTMVSTETTQSAKIDEKIKPEKIVKSKHVNTSKQAKMKSKMTRKEIKKQMEKSLKRGEYKMKVGRLIFWDFGGQYVYYTTHQTFMTYRALFLVVFDGSKDLYDEVSDVLCFPGQHGTPTPAGIHCLR
jgi:GTPase SAR1 family protein